MNRTLSSTNGRAALAALVLAGLIAAPGIAGGRSAARAHAASATVVGTVTINTHKVLANSRGHVLYMFTGDRKNRSTCSGGCNRTWKPLLAPGGVTYKRHSGVSGGMLKTFKNGSGNQQVEYNNHPLYTNVGDRHAGEDNGEGQPGARNGVWYVIGPKGNERMCTDPVCIY